MLNLGSPDNAIHLLNLETFIGFLCMKTYFICLSLIKARHFVQINSRIQIKKNTPFCKSAHDYWFP